MPKARKKVKDEFWFAIIFIGIFVFVLLADWWKENAVLGWIILSILLIAAGFFLYRFASLRGWLGRQAKDTAKKIVFKEVASSRNRFRKTRGMKCLNEHIFDARMNVATSRVDLTYTILMQITAITAWVIW